MSGSWQQIAAVLLDLGTWKRVTKKTKNAEMIIFWPSIPSECIFSKSTFKNLQPSPGHILWKSYRILGFDDVLMKFDDVFPVTATCDVNVTSQWRHTRHILIFCNHWVPFSNPAKFYLQQIISRHCLARGPCAPPHSKQVFVMFIVNRVNTDLTPMD